MTDEYVSAASMLVRLLMADPDSVDIQRELYEWLQTEPLEGVQVLIAALAGWSQSLASDWDRDEYLDTVFNAAQIIIADEVDDAV